MRDAFHRVMSGTPVRRGELVFAGIFAAIWFAMDAAQWIDWLQLKIWPVAVVCLK